MCLGTCVLRSVSTCGPAAPRHLGTAAGLRLGTPRARRPGPGSRRVARGGPGAGLLGSGAGGSVCRGGGRSCTAEQGQDSGPRRGVACHPGVRVRTSGCPVRALGTETECPAFCGRDRHVMVVAATSHGFAVPSPPWSSVLTHTVTDQWVGWLAHLAAGRGHPGCPAHGGLVWPHVWARGLLGHWDPLSSGLPAGPGKAAQRNLG